MEITLKVLRSEITTLLFKGPKPDDSQLPSSFFEQLILDARAQIIPIDFGERKELDEEWFSNFDLDVDVTTSGKETIYSATLPKLIHLPKNFGLRIKGIGDDPNRLVYYEMISKERIPFFRKNGYRNGDPVFSKVGNKVTFLTSKIIKKVEVEAIVFDPTKLTGYTDTTPFPVSSSTINAMKEVLRKTDINQLIHGEIDNANNSIPSISYTKAPQEQE